MPGGKVFDRSPNISVQETTVAEKKSRIHLRGFVGRTARVCVCFKKSRLKIKTEFPLNAPKKEAAKEKQKITRSFSKPGKSTAYIRCALPVSKEANGTLPQPLGPGQQIQGPPSKAENTGETGQEKKWLFRWFFSQNNGGFPRFSGGFFLDLLFCRKDSQSE